MRGGSLVGRLKAAPTYKAGVLVRIGRSRRGGAIAWGPGYLVGPGDRV